MCYIMCIMCQCIYLIWFKEDHAVSDCLREVQSGVQYLIHWLKLISHFSLDWYDNSLPQGKLPLASMTVSKLEDCDAHKNGFELNGKSTLSKQNSECN